MGDVSGWWDALPPQPEHGSADEMGAYLAEVERLVLEAPLVEHVWHELWMGPRLRVFVSARSATIDGRRLRYSAATQYRAGRRIRGWLLTPALSDRIFQRADTRLEPTTLSDGAGHAAPDMAYPSAWARQDDAIARGPALVGLVSGEGKDWASTPAWSETRAANYGMHRRDGRPWQGLGLRHDPSHVDYSQHGRWVGELAVLDNAAVDFLDVISGRLGPELAHAVGGPMHTLVPPWEHP